MSELSLLGSVRLKITLGTFTRVSSIEEEPELGAFVPKDQSFNNAPELSTADKERLEQLLNRHPDTVAHEFDLAPAASVRHNIQLMEGAQLPRASSASAQESSGVEAATDATARSHRTVIESLGE